MREIRDSRRGRIEIDEDVVVHGALRGSAIVRRGRKLRIAPTGVGQGMTHVEDGGSLDVEGLLQGALYIAAGATVAILGRVEGAIHNDGRLVVRGVHRGAWSGDGHTEFAPDADTSRSVHVRRVRVKERALGAAAD